MGSCFHSHKDVDVLQTGILCFPVISKLLTHFCITFEHFEELHQSKTCTRCSKAWV